MLMFFLLSIVSVNGQSDGLFKFENSIVIWSHNSVVEKFQDEIFALQPLKPLVIGNDIYITQNIQKRFFAGHVTEKLNADDGSLLWKYHYLKGDDSKREYAKRPYLEDNLLKMMVFREKDVGGILWWDAVMSQVTLDTSTGTKIDSIVTNSNDTLNQILGMPITPYNYYLSTSFLYPFGRKILYIQRKGLGFFIKYHYKILDKQGHVINDTVITRTDTTLSFQNVKYISSKEISDTSTMVLKHYIHFANQKDPFSVKYEINDTHGEFSEEVDISNSLESSYQFNLDFANIDFFIISARDSIFENGKLYEQKRFHMFNIKGELLETVIFDKKTNESYFEISQPIVLKQEKKMFFCMTKDIEGFQNLFFLMSNGNGKLNTLKVLKMESEKDKIIVKMIHPINNKNLLINFSHLDTEKDRKSYNSIWMLFENKSIGISTSINEELSAFLEEIYLYPNPAQNLLVIKSAQNINANISICDILGREVLYDTMNGSKKEINISKLLPGIHNINFVTKDKKQKTIIFLKE